MAYFIIIRLLLRGAYNMNKIFPTISIIIPVYNGQEFIGKCIESVINQTYRQLEILCIDDGSTDATGDILRKYQSTDKRLHIFTTENKGVSCARNCALEQLHGDYVMFVDGDDWIDEDICERALKVALDKSVDLVFWSYTREYAASSRIKSVIGTNEVYYDKNEVLQLRRKLFGLIGGELRETDKGNSLVPVWGKLYKREAIGNSRFTDIKTIGTGEDILFNIDVFANLASAEYIPTYAYHYRRYNTDSITTLYNPKLFDMWQNLYSRMQTYIENENLGSEYAQALSNRRALGLIALGQNVLASGRGYKSQLFDFKKILTDERYVIAFKNLPLEYMSLHWKVFFSLARLKNPFGVYCLSKVIQKIREK